MLCTSVADQKKGANVSVDSLVLTAIIARECKRHTIQLYNKLLNQLIQAIFYYVF